MDDFETQFSYTESLLWDDAFGDFHDATAEALYHAAYFSPGEYNAQEVSAIREALNDYLRDEYDIDFDAEFDWESWREGYEAA